MINTAESTRTQLSEAVRDRDKSAQKLDRLIRHASEVGLSQRDIAATIGVSQSAVSQLLSTSRSRALAKHPIGSRLMEHRAEIIDIAKAHKVSRIHIFGSVAEGRETNDSDVDLLVTMPPDRGMLDVAQLGEELSDILGVPVDVVPEHMVKPKALAALKLKAIAL